MGASIKDVRKNSPILDPHLPPCHKFNMERVPLLTQAVTKSRLPYSLLADVLYGRHLYAIKKNAFARTWGRQVDIGIIISSFRERYI